MPSGVSVVPRPSDSLYITPKSQFAKAATWLATPFEETAAANRSLVPTSQLTMKPPYELP